MKMAPIRGPSMLRMVFVPQPTDDGTKVPQLTVEGTEVSQRIIIIIL